MTGLPDWAFWALGAALLALFALFFWHTAGMMLDMLRRLIATIQHWPEVRRGMVEAEAQHGGRYPLWYRAIRIGLVLVLVGLMAVFLWLRLAGA